MEMNHVSDKLSNDEIDELIAYYNTYKGKAWAYKQHYKYHKRLRFVADNASLLIASSSIASAIVFLPTVAITSIAILIQSWIKYKDYDFKIRTSLYAYQIYSHLLIRIRDILRSGDLKENHY